MISEKPKFNSGLVILCTRCKPRLAKRQIEAQDFTSLRVLLKAKFKESGIWGSVRACESTCLGHCPAQASTLFIQNQKTNAQVCLIVPPQASDEDILKKVKNHLHLED